MNCPVWDCDEVLALNGGQFIMNGKIVSHGRCPVHGLIKMRLMGKTQVYTYTWGNTAKRATMKGRTCVVLKWGKLNSCMVMFCDTGKREIISRNAIRKLTSCVVEQNRNLFHKK